MAQECLDKYECDGQPLDSMHPIQGIPTRCSACTRIARVAQELNNLVVREPYLITGGMSTAPRKPSWDLVEKKSFECDKDEGSLGDGRNDKERQQFLDKVVQSFINTAGQGMTEEEVYSQGAPQCGRDSPGSNEAVENSNNGRKEGGQIVSDVKAP